MEPASLISPTLPLLNGFPRTALPFSRVAAVSSGRRRLSRKLVSNGYAGAQSRSLNPKTNKTYARRESCLVVPPSPIGKIPRAIIKFLGGAFIGAVPEVTYSYLVELLAKEGFLVISVPYNVTFDHSQATEQVYQRFNSCLDSVLESGIPDANLTAEQLAGLPLFCVGHRPATEAVPYFEQVGPLVNQIKPLVEVSPIYSMAMTASGDAWKAILDAAGAIVTEIDQEGFASFNKFIDQLPSVLNQVADGVSEFKPTPSENRDCFGNLYNVPHTLLVKFNTDAIDETDLLEETLRPRVQSIGGTIEKVELSGTHITPCVQEPKWQVGSIYTPADAVAQGLKALSLNDTRVLSRTISDWFRRFEN